MRVRRGRGPYFAQVPWELQDTAGIDAATIATYAALQRYADFGQSTGCRVSDAVAAKKAGLSRRTFINRRARLRQLGWVTWESGKAEGGVNMYVIHRSLEQEGVQDVQTPVHEAPTPSELRADPGVQEMHTTESPSTENPTKTEESARATPRAETSPSSEPDLDESSMSYLLGLVRSKLYVPDGQPPANWDIARDGSILKQLRRAYRPRDIGIAIEGLAIVRDHPGIFADEVDWLKTGSKVTLRALYHSSSGVLPMFTIATQAYWKYANSRRSQKDSTGPQHLGSFLRQAIETASASKRRADLESVERGP
jgi:hypothetical protein